MSHLCVASFLDSLEDMLENTEVAPPNFTHTTKALRMIETLINGKLTSKMVDHVSVNILPENLGGYFIGTSVCFGKHFTRKLKRPLYIGMSKGFSLAIIIFSGAIVMWNFPLRTWSQ